MFTISAPRHVTSSGLIAEVLVDPSEPYLADHRPGGVPLLGTVMTLELMAAAVAQLVGESSISMISDVEILAPVTFRSRSPQLVRLSAGPGSDGVSIACRSETMAVDGTVTVHQRANFRSASSAGWPQVQSANMQTRSSSVRGDGIYRAFFHGPAFQVVDEAKWDGCLMLARLRQPLMPLRHPAEAGNRIQPQIIEFGLQTIGLAQLARFGQMRIPLRIQQVILAADRSLPETLIASVAVPPNAGVDDPMDVAIDDERGRVFAEVRGFATTSMASPGLNTATAASPSAAVGSGEGESDLAGSPRVLRDKLVQRF